MQNTTLRHELGMAFGTRKSKKAIASMTDNAISTQKKRGEPSAGPAAKPDPLAAAVLESMSTFAGSALSREEMETSAQSSNLRPTANLSATTPAEVYPLDTLISNEELGALEVAGWIDAVNAKEDVQTHSRYVSRRLEGLCKRREVRKLKVLKYILLLIEWFLALKTSPLGGRKLPPKDDLAKKISASPTLLDGVRRKFASAGYEVTPT